MNARNSTTQANDNNHKQTFVFSSCWYTYIHPRQSTKKTAQSPQAAVVAAARAAPGWAALRHAERAAMLQHLGNPRALGVSGFGGLGSESYSEFLFSRGVYMGIL